MVHGIVSFEGADWSSCLQLIYQQCVRLLQRGDYYNVVHVSTLKKKLKENQIYFAADVKSPQEDCPRLVS